MSYTTCCPACRTIFRIALDQLKLLDGWVRCGHCANVFNATLYLQPWETTQVKTQSAPLTVDVTSTQEGIGAWPTAASSNVDHSGSNPVNSTTGAFATPVAPGRIRIQDNFQADLMRFVGTRTASVVNPQADDSGKLRTSHRDTPLSGAQISRQQSTDASVDNLLPRTPHIPEGVETPSDQGDDAGYTAALTASAPSGDAKVATYSTTDEPNFLRQARRQAFWRSLPVRVMLLLFSLLLLVLLIAQWVVHDRDRLAASHPDLAPVLTQLCAPLGCQISPPQQIDAVVIDSAALVRRLANFYAFDVVLKNTAQMVVAMPALELTVTDIKDRVIARRVFLQREIPGAPAQLAPQSSLSLNLRLTLSNEGEDASTMAGYRALVFYP